MKNTLLALIMVVTSAIATFGQDPTPANTVEVRASTTQYGYVDWVHVFPGKVLGQTWVSDVTYIKTPGSSEINVGGGPQLAIGKLGSITPAVYGVIDAQTKQAGIKLGLATGLQYKHVKISAFAAHLFYPNGEDYDVIDPLEATWSLGSVDVGFSMGLFRQAGSQDVQKGAVVKWNHKNTSLSFSLRRNSVGQTESRLGFIVSF